MNLKGKMTQKRQQIIKAAEKRFVRHGLLKTTLEEIARDLRVGKATVYYYFDSKEQLYYEVINSQISDFGNVLSEIFNNVELSAKDKFEQYIKMKEEFETLYPLVFRLFSNVLEEFPYDKETELIKKVLTTESEKLKEFIKNLPVLKKTKSQLTEIIDFIIWGSYSNSMIKKMDRVIEPDGSFTISKRYSNFLVSLFMDKINSEQVAE